MTDRRTFVSLVAGTCLLEPFAVRAQQAVGLLERIGELRVAEPREHRKRAHRFEERLREALQVLEAARPKFADHPRMWPDLIRMYRRVGRAAEASQLQLRCQVEFPDFKKLCDEGAQRPG